MSLLDAIRTALGRLPEPPPGAAGSRRGPGAPFGTGAPRGRVAPFDPVVPPGPEAPHGPGAGAGAGAPFGRGSEGEHRLQREFGTADRAAAFYRDQVLDRLNERMREFIGRQEMLFVATADGGGECDCSLRAGPPGFVRVLGERVLAYPEYRGNGVLASLGNTRENPHAGLLFVDFQHARIGLHVNGTVRTVSDADMRLRRPDLPADPAPGRRPVAWVELTVEEAYVHCSKHIPRLVRVPAAARAWGSDDLRRKGGDFFGVAAGRRSGAEEPVVRGEGVREAVPGEGGREAVRGEGGRGGAGPAGGAEPAASRPVPDGPVVGSLSAQVAGE